MSTLEKPRYVPTDLHPLSFRKARDGSLNTGHDVVLIEGGRGHRKTETFPQNSDLFFREVS